MPNINSNSKKQVLVVDMGGVNVKLSDYQNKPILVLDVNGAGYTTQFGISKARAILNQISQIEAYVNGYDQLVPKQAKEPKVNTNSFKNVAWAKNLINA